MDFHSLALLSLIVAIGFALLRCPPQAYSFKEAHLGPVIGRRTWGGVATVDTQRLVDGGELGIPVESCTRDDDQGPQIENYGVEPDITVYSRPGEDVDSQLQEAVRSLLEQLGTGVSGVPPGIVSPT